MTQFIAERRLLYSLKGNDTREELVIRLGAPYSVKEGMVDFPVGENGYSGCHIEVVGLNEGDQEVYGADSLQAVALASSAVEAFLKRLQKRYDIYHLSGEPYFESPNCEKALAPLSDPTCDQRLIVVDPRAPVGGRNRSGHSKSWSP